MNSHNGLMGFTTSIPFATRSRWRVFASGFMEITPDFKVGTETFACEEYGITTRIKTRMRILFVSSMELSPLLCDSFASSTSALHTALTVHCLRSNGEYPSPDASCFFWNIGRIQFWIGYPVQYTQSPLNSGWGWPSQWPPKLRTAWLWWNWHFWEVFENLTVNRTHSESSKGRPLPLYSLVVASLLAIWCYHSGRGDGLLMMLNPLPVSKSHCDDVITSMVAPLEQRTKWWRHTLHLLWKFFDGSIEEVVRRRKCTDGTIFRCHWRIAKITLRQHCPCSGSSMFSSSSVPFSRGIPFFCIANFFDISSRIPLVVCWNDYVSYWIPLLFYDCGFVFFRIHRRRPPIFQKFLADCWSHLLPSHLAPYYYSVLIFSTWILIHIYRKFSIEYWRCLQLILFLYVGAGFTFVHRRGFYLLMYFSLRGRGKLGFGKKSRSKI